jgi:hypothetical protein
MKQSAYLIHTKSLVYNTLNINDLAILHNSLQLLIHKVVLSVQKNKQFLSLSRTRTHAWVHNVENWTYDYSETSIYHSSMFHFPGNIFQYPGSQYKFYLNYGD